MYILVNKAVYINDNDDDELAHGENARLKHDIFDSSVRTNIFGVLVFDRLPVDRQTACQKTTDSQQMVRN